MATMNALYFVVAGIMFLLKVTSAQWGSLDVPDMVAYTGKVFYVSFTSHPVYGDLAVSVKISASHSSDSRSLPPWLTFNTTTRSLSGVPLTEDQGWILLNVKAECAQVNTPLRSNNVACHESTNLLKLTVLPFSWADFLLPSAILPEVSPTTVLYFRSTDSEDGPLEENSCEEDRVIASLVLCASLENLSSEERLALVTHLSDFLSIPVSSFILESSSSHRLKAVENGFQMVSAGPGTGESCSLNQNIEIIWTLSCSTVKHLTDFVRVLQHNADGGRLQNEIKAGIVGWYVASSNSLHTRQTRRRRRSSHRTVVPTPVISPLRPTAGVVDNSDDVWITSVEVSSPVQHLSSSDFIFSSDGDIEESSRIIFTPQISQTYEGADEESNQFIFSPSSSPTYDEDDEESIQVIFPPEILQTSVAILPIASDQMLSSPSPTPSFVSMSTSSTLLSVDSELSEQILQTSSTVVEMSSDTNYPDTRDSVLPITVTTTELSPELMLITKTHVSTIDELQTVVVMSSIVLSHDNATAIILETEHSSPSPLSPSSRFSSLSSVLPTDSVYLVTSRAVEIVAFSVSLTEPNIDAETTSHSFLSPSTTTDSIDVSPFIHKPSVDSGYYSTEIVLSEILFDSQHAEVRYSSTLPMSLPQYEQEMSSTFPTIPAEDIETSPAATLAPALSQKTPSIVDDATDDDTSNTLTLRVDVDETGESLFSGDYISVSNTDVSTADVSTTDVFVVESSADYAIQPTQSEEIKVTTGVWTPVTSMVQVDIETPTRQMEDGDTTERLANKTLFVQSPIGLIVGEPGKLLEFNISRVFSNVEGGSNSSLTLSLELPSNQELPSDFWLYLDSEKQMLKGLPLQTDMAVKNASVLLVARHSTGLIATDTILLQITDAPRDFSTHAFIMKFALNFQQFMRSRKNLTDLIVRIGSYFENNGAEFMRVLKVEPGSLKISWTNNTLTGTECQMDAIKNIFGRMVRQDGTFKSAFYRHITRENQLTEILFEPRGACIIPLSTTITTTTTHVVSDTIRGYDLSIWAHVILPVMIAVLVFVLIILIIIFCNRRRRHRQAVLNAEKEAVSNDRNPIIFPDELDVDDPSLKAKYPLVLPTDAHLDNQSVPLDASPTKSSRDQEKTRSRDREQTRGRDHERAKSRDHERARSRDYERTRKQDYQLPRSQSQGEQDWKERDSHIRGVDNDVDHRKRKDSKRQKDHSRLAGVNTTSTQSCDRPNNHYLEEEAESRSSTLKSTKSLGSEKRHPKSPPPYWQSQSNPPPYRLPPSYLTDQTQV